MTTLGHDSSGHKSILHPRKLVLLRMHPVSRDEEVSFFLLSWECSGSLVMASSCHDADAFLCFQGLVSSPVWRQIDSSL